MEARNKTCYSAANKVPSPAITRPTVWLDSRCLVFFNSPQVSNSPLFFRQHINSDTFSHSFLLLSSASRDNLTLKYNQILLFMLLYDQNDKANNSSYRTQNGRLHDGFTPQHPPTTPTDRWWVFGSVSCYRQAPSVHPLFWVFPFSIASENGVVAGKCRWNGN